MAYRQSLMKYAEKYGAGRKYNKSRSYIYFWRQRWDGSGVPCLSHSHPNQHTEAELKLVRNMRRRNPALGMIELWHRLRLRGYTRCPEILFRIMRKIKLFPAEKPKKKYKPKPYEQMTYPRPAGSGGCEGGSEKMYRRPRAAPVPVHRNRRVHAAAFFGRLS